MDLSSRFPHFKAFSPGDIAPKWIFLDPAGHEVDLTQDWIAGNWIVLFLGPADEPALDFDASELANFARRMAATGARFFRVQTADVGSPVSGAQARAGIDVLRDAQGQLARDLGLSTPRTLTMVIRPDAHFAAFYDGPVNEQLRAALSLVEDATSRSPEVELGLRHPPVLLVPEVFSRTECAALINLFNAEGQILLDKDRATDHIGTDYKMRVADHEREDRVDHFFFNPQTIAFLTHRLNRVIPEIAKAFQYPVTKYESLRMARYRGTRAGRAHGHRDNVPPTTYRRFALSINLNTEDFEGGSLRFAEFGNVRYRPASGTAIIFSSSLLHEALHVTRGERYVFLAFMFGER